MSFNDENRNLIFSKCYLVQFFPYPKMIFCLFICSFAVTTYNNYSKTKTPPTKIRCKILSLDSRFSNSRPFVLRYCLSSALVLLFLRI